MEKVKQNTGKPRRDMDGQNWRGLKWIELGKFEKRRPIFIQIYSMSVYTFIKSWKIILSCYVAMIFFIFYFTPFVKQIDINRDNKVGKFKQLRCIRFYFFF